MIYLIEYEPFVKSNLLSSDSSLHLRIFENFHAVISADEISRMENWTL